MVMAMNIGVLAIQGDVSEHINAVKNAMDFYKIKGSVQKIKRKGDIKDLDFLIIPGGESTTISKLMIRYGIFDAVLERALNDELGVMGTCAGSILMAREVVDDSRVKTLGLMNMAVRRNFFGRQRESFESEIHIEGIGNYHAIFIRAPVIEHCSPPCKVLAKIGDKIAMAKQGNFLALIFHPELTNDPRIYKFIFE